MRRANFASKLTNKKLYPFSCSILSSSSTALVHRNLDTHGILQNVFPHAIYTTDKQLGRHFLKVWVVLGLLMSSCYN